MLTVSNVSLGRLDDVDRAETPWGVWNLPLGWWDERDGLLGPLGDSPRDSRDYLGRQREPPQLTRV